MWVATTAGCAAHLTSPGDPDPRNAPRYTFTRDIYPILERSCSRCHTRGGTAPNLPFDEGPETTYGYLMSRSGTINMIVASESTLLTMPLAETPSNHPSTDWPDATHPDYRKVLTWILQAAPM